MPDNDNDSLIIVGRNPVFEALERRPDYLEKVMVDRDLPGRAAAALRRQAEQAGVTVQYVPSQKLDQVAGGANHQGMAAVAAPMRYRQVDEMLGAVASSLDEVKARKPMLLVIDRVTDPYNYGAILRSAVAAGAEAVIVPDRHMAPLSAVTIKASAGTAPRVPIAQVSDLAETLEALKERGYWVVGAAGESDDTLWDMDWDRPLALVIGSEGEGLRREVREVCDFLVSIPMRGPAESLNASVAAGVLLFAAAGVR